MKNLEKKSALIIVIMSFIYIIPLLLSNNLYADDIWRVWSGYPGFLENGRFMSEALMFLISSGYGVFDSFPIPQLIASFIYWWSGYVLSKKISPSKDEFWHILIGSSLLISPFTISQISFRFDAITMSISVLCVTYSYIYLKENIQSYLLALSLIIISLGFYQPSIIIAFSLPFVEIIIKKERFEFKKDLKKITKFTLIVFSAFVFYKKIILAILPTGQYTEDHSGMLPISLDSIQIIKESFSSINKIFKDLISSSDGYVYVAILLFPVLFIAYASIKKMEGIGTISIKLLSILAIACTLYLPIALLKSPIIEPRVISSGCLFIFLFLSAVSNINKFNIGKLISFIVILHFFIMMAMYSNTLKLTNNENESFNSSLATSLENSGWVDGDALYFSGRLKHTQPVIRFFEKFPFYKRIIQYYYVDSYVLGYFSSNINGLNIIRDGDYYIPTVSDKWKIINSNRYGDLYLNKGKYLFKFNE